jgi:hypothetical protein
MTTARAHIVVRRKAKDGNNGRGVLSVTEYYAKSSSNSSAPSSWSTTVPTVDATYPYLWNYEKVTYTDGSYVNTTPAVIGHYGKDGTNGTNGRGISSVVEYYAKSNSGTTAPASSSFSTTVPTIDATNPYLWNYERINYTDNTYSTTTPVVIGHFGKDGQDGQDGTDGTDGKDAPCTVFRGTYDSTAYYYGTSQRCDIVKYSGSYYLAKRNAPTSPFKNILPTNTNYWAPFGSSFESVATGLLFTEEAVIENAVIRKLRTAETGKRVLAQNNQISVYDAGNAQRLNISGETIDVGAPTASYPLNQGAGDNESHYRAQGTSGQSQMQFDICTFSVPSSNTQVQIPAISIKGYLEQYWYGGGLWNMEGDISIYRSNGTFVTTLKSESYNTYGDINYAGGTLTLGSGTYYIRVSIEFEWDVDPSTEYDSGINISFYNNSAGFVVVSASTTQGIQIGANGITISLGDSFSAIFALDGNTPTMILQGINNSNQAIGLKITKSGGVQINRGSGWVSL